MGACMASSLARPAHVPSATIPRYTPPARRWFVGPEIPPLKRGYMPEALARAGPYPKPPFAAVQAARIVATDWRSGFGL